jgi:hypothetical protein
MATRLRFSTGWVAGHLSAAAMASASCCSACRTPAWLGAVALRCAASPRSATNGCKLSSTYRAPHQPLKFMLNIVLVPRHATAVGSSIPDVDRPHLQCGIDVARVAKVGHAERAAAGRRGCLAPECAGRPAQAAVLRPAVCELVPLRRQGLPLLAANLAIPAACKAISAAVPSRGWAVLGVGSAIRASMRLLGRNETAAGALRRCRAGGWTVAVCCTWAGCSRRPLQLGDSAGARPGPSTLCREPCKFIYKCIYTNVSKQLDCKTEGGGLC